MKIWRSVSSLYFVLDLQGMECTSAAVRNKNDVGFVLGNETRFALSEIACFIK